MDIESTSNIQRMFWRLKSNPIGTFLKINNLYILPKGVTTNVKDMRVFASKQNVGWKEENYRLGAVQFYFFSSKQGQFRWVGNDHYFYVLINDHLPIVVGMHALIFHIT